MELSPMHIAYSKLPNNRMVGFYLTEHPQSQATILRLALGKIRITSVLNLFVYLCYPFVYHNYNQPIKVIIHFGCYIKLIWNIFFFWT
jgi:hypothetical protein